MESGGLIAETEGPDDADARRRYYRLTVEGRRVAEDESSRLMSLVTVARSRNLLPDAGG